MTFQSPQHTGRNHPGNVAAHRSDLADEGAGDEGELGGRRQEDRVHGGQHGAIGVGHLNFVLQVRGSTQSAYDELRAVLSASVDQEAVRGGHTHQGLVPQRLRDQLEPLLEAEERLFARMGGHQHGHRFETLRAATNEVHVPVGDRVEAAREESVLSTHGHKCSEGLFRIRGETRSSSERLRTETMKWRFEQRPDPEADGGRSGGKGGREGCGRHSMGERTLHREVPQVKRQAIERPLMAVFAGCVTGHALGSRAGLAGVGALVLGLLFLLGLWIRLHPGDAAGQGQRIQGLAWPALILLVALAGLRAASSRSRLDGHRAPPYSGRWLSETSGSKLLGRLEGQPQRFELPQGSVRNGEWLRLSPTRTPSPAARGPATRRSQGVGAALIEVRADEIERLAPARLTGFEATRAGLEGWRQAGVRRLRELNSARARGLACALLFGDRSELPMGLGDLFTRTGTRHALAVSGLHVALVASLWIWPLGALLAWPWKAWRRRPRWMAWLSRPELWRVLLLSAFAPLAGAGAPVVRASMALALAQVAGLLPREGALRLRRRADALSLWALAGCVEWWIDPRALSSLSMQLSYGATLGLILFSPRFLQALRRRLPGGGRVSETNRAGRLRHPAWRLVLQRTLDVLSMALVASLAANLATLPLVWWTFGEWSLAGPFATLLLLPLMALFIGLAWLWMLWPLELFNSLLSWSAEAMVALLSVFDRLPGTPLPLPHRPAWLLCVAGVAAWLAARYDLPGRPRWWRVCFASWGLLLLPWWRGARGLEIHALDVGHGTCVVFRAPGEACWIFDGGSRDRPRVATNALAPLLREWDVGEVVVALSHGEADHARALPWIIERYPPSLWLGALPAHLRGRLPHDCRQVDLPQGRVLGSDSPGGPGRLQWSLIRGEAGEGNEGSRSLEVTWQGHRVVLCGDAEGSGLATQLRQSWLSGPYDLMLFPHHGSETASLTPLLESTQPRETWFSCSQRPRVAGELDRLGLSWDSTARSGPLQRNWEAGSCAQEIGGRAP